jgi:hypothetical protein
MTAEQSSQGEPRNHHEAVQHITEATTLLRTLRQDLDKHPEIEEAIQKLELALAILTVKTGGLL